MRIFFLARSLHIGGGERQLALLAIALQREGHDVAVAVYYAGGALEEGLRSAGVQVVDLRKRGRWDIFVFLLRLVRAVRAVQPDLIYPFLYGPNLVAVLIKPWLRRIPVVWGVRASNLDLSCYGWHTRLAYRLACRLARFADLIVCNSTAGMGHTLASGFPADKTIVIHNGIDTRRFKPDGEARKRVRAEWRVAANQILVGLVARLDPMKDHPTFLRAASQLAKVRADVRFVCVGDGPGPYKSELRNLARALELSKLLIWADERTDMPEVYPAIDIVALSSVTEGFPNVVAEAMASGVPCVATDVGDAAEIVGDAGRVVPPGAPELLSQGILGLIAKLDDKRMGLMARERIVGHYSVERMVRDTERALKGILAERETAGHSKA